MKPAPTPYQYKQAKNVTLGQLTEVLKVIEKTDLHNLKLDMPEEQAAAISFLNLARERAVEIVAFGDNQYANRPQALIQSAATRMLAIPAMIDNEGRAFNSLQANIEFKHKDLIKKGYTQAEAEKITPPITSEQRSEHHQKIKSLQFDNQQLEAFLRDSPRYQVSILAGSTLEVVE